MKLTIDFRHGMTGALTATYLRELADKLEASPTRTGNGVLRDRRSEEVASWKLQPYPVSSNPRLLVAMDGGCIEGVYSDDPNLIGTTVAMIDYDIVFCNEDELTDIDQGDGTTQRGTLHTAEVEALGIPWPVKS